MGSFDKEMNVAQKAWRKRHVSTQEKGMQNGREYPWILPQENWVEGLWPGIRPGSENDLNEYLKCAGVQKHYGVHNLKSSWVLGANLYFAHRVDKTMAAAFLADCLDERIVSIDAIELEWAEKCPLDPATLLGEPKGKRGANQTSPDVAFLVSLRGGGRGLVLTELKFTEHSFYRCSGREKKNGNCKPERCLSAQNVIADPQSECHLLNWERGRRKNRLYWDYISFSQAGRTALRRCPAATAGYQLFRQQALAEAIARRGEYEVVVSAIAYDARNQRLVRSMRSTGLSDFTRDWGALFDGQAHFASFTHQQWVAWVRENDTDGRWCHWLSWVADRYDY